MASKGRKRGHGEGSIYPVRDKEGKVIGYRGAVTVRYEYDIATGKPKRIRKTVFRKKRQAVADELVKLQAQQRQGMNVAPERQTVAQFLDNWLKNVSAPTIRPATFRLYEYLIRIHIKPTLGGVQLVKVTPQRVNDLISAKREEGLSESTLRSIHTILHKSFKQAMLWDMVPRNVVSLVTAPKPDRPEARYWTVDQARQFLEAMQGDRLEALYVVVISLGLRQGEALALLWQDVDLDGGSLWVRKTLQRVGGKLSREAPKTKRSVAQIMLPAITVDALRQHQQLQEREREWAGSQWQEHGLVFCTPAGKPLPTSTLAAYYRAAITKAGLPYIKFHELRHTCAALLLAQGVQLKAVQEILRHSSIRITGDTYAHIVPSIKQGAAALMNNLLSSTKEGE